MSAFKDSLVLNDHETAALLALDASSEQPGTPAVFLESTPLSGQQAGAHLLDTLQMIAAAQEQTPVDEELLQMAFHTLALHINVLFEAEAQLVLTGHAGCFLLNQELIDLPPAERWALTQCWRRLEQKGLGGVMVMRAATPEEIAGFFGALMSHNEDPEATGSLYPLTKENAIARIDAHEREQLSRRGMERADPTGFALTLCAHILQWVQQRYHPLSPRPPRRKVARYLQELAALCEGQQVFFLGFTAPEGSPHSQAYHVTNTAILAVLFGGVLGLERSQRIELALITLEHDLGKLDLPTELLEKTEPLSEEEHKTFEYLPLRTARRLLDQRFAWSRLKHALIAIDVRVRPDHSGAVSNDNADSTLFFSRIISLCACFDSLCVTRKGSRAMSPDEALCFMRGSLSDRFDPTLLQRFIAFLIPGIHAATGRLLHPLPPRKERNAFNHEAHSPALEELQQLLKAYQRLKQEPEIADTTKIASLRSQLTERLRAAAAV